MSNRRIRSISPNDPKALEKVIEALEVSEGIRGNGDDRKPTIAEVKSMIGGDSSTFVGLTAPGAPRGLRIIQNQYFVAIDWTIPSNKDHESTDIYRSTTNDIDGAVKVGNTETSYFIDLFSEQGVYCYYFVRHRNIQSTGLYIGQFSPSLQIKRNLTPAAPVIRTGYLDQNNTIKVVNLGFIEAWRSIRVSIHANFWLRKRYAFDTEQLVTTGGNTHSVKISRTPEVQEVHVDNNWEDTAFPTVAETSLRGPYGQKSYSYLLDREFIDRPNQHGDAEYVIEAIPNMAAPGAFKMFYTIELI
jgi:hypothetical protein